MIPRPLLIAALIGAMLCLSASAAQAQRQGRVRGMVISVRDHEQPRTDVTVTTRRGRVRGQVIRPDRDDRAIVEEPAFSEGDRIAVYVKRCVEGQVEIILAKEGDGDDVCVEEDAQAGDRCGCELLGFITWHDGGTAVVDIGTGQITELPPDAAPATGLSTGPVVGLKLDAAFWTNLKDNVCNHEGVAGCESDEVAIVPVVFSEYWYAPNFGVGFTGLYSRIDAVQTLDPEAGFSSNVDIEMTTVGVGPYATGRIGLSPIATLQLLVGFLYLWNSADFHSQSGGETLTEERTDDGLRLDLGTALDLLLTERVGLRFNLNYTSGGGDDSDTQVRVGAGIRVGSR